MAKIKTTLIKGLSFNILIEEVHDQDGKGGLLCYVASIYLQERGSAEKKLIRRSRLPGAANELRKEIRRNGIRVFDRFKDL
ncbi:hypothetical protein N5K21_27350 [Rhizobium pusense]|uniref:hypothetical protein n=1 Tax=Agrobacterium pusense TaxID=648995 RepID=UPI0024469DBD|nr:hypothetical protein [Agrobacterium pusense]MDH2092439.1 hypothetical protein [Agrobacterium pusense]